MMSSVGPGELVAVVGDVRQQVGELAVGLDEHTVLVVAMVTAAQPDRPLLVVDGVGGPQVGQGGVDGARPDHRPLAEPGVEPDVE